MGWEHLTTNFPDREGIRAILGICRFGARIGYSQLCSKPTIYPNLAIADTDISSELNKNQLDTYSDINTRPSLYTASPLGLVDKAD